MRDILARWPKLGTIARELAVLARAKALRYSRAKTPGSCTSEPARCSTVGRDECLQSGSSRGDGPVRATEEREVGSEEPVGGSHEDITNPPVGSCYERGLLGHAVLLGNPSPGEQNEPERAAGCTSHGAAEDALPGCRTPASSVLLSAVDYCPENEWDLGAIGRMGSGSGEILPLASGSGGDGEGHGGGGGEAAFRAFKKTRRGKRAGGAVSRRTGAKQKAASRAPEGPDDPGATWGGGKGQPTPVARAKGDEGGDGHVSSCSQPADGRRDPEALSRRAGKAGGADANACGSLGLGVHVAGRGFDAASDVPVPALEHAAVRPLRDLQRILCSVASDAGSSGKARGARECARDGVSASHIASMLRLCIRRAGILESILLIFAPFPWVPVASQRGASPYGLRSSEMAGLTVERPGMSRDEEDLACGKISATRPATVSTRGADSGPVPASGPLCPGPGEPSALLSSSSESSSSSATTGARGWGRGRYFPALGAVEGRDALAATALGVLAEALEDTGSLEHVLSIDGAAPVVSELGALGTVYAVPSWRIPAH